MISKNLIFRSKISYIISLLILSLLLFVINVFIRRLETETIWGLSIIVASLLGVLVTAGAAFATVAAIISYVSVNDKLKLSSENLKEINDKISQNRVVLDNIDELVERKNGLRELYEQLSSQKDKFKVVIDKNASELEGCLLDVDFGKYDKEKLRKTAKKILNENYPELLKIKARFVLIRLSIKELGDKDDILRMYHAYSEYEKCCEVLYLYDPNIINQYLSAIFNKAYHLNKSELMFDTFSQVQELYRKLIYLSEKYDLNKNQRKIAYNNLACLLFYRSKEIFKSHAKYSYVMFDECIHCLEKSILLDLKYEKAIENIKKFIESRFKLLEQDNKREKLKSSVIGIFKSLPQSETKTDLIKFVEGLK